MSDPEPLLGWLQNWYVQQCNGDWEHEWGVKIAMLDNPGWTVSIDLEETGLEEREYPRQEINRSPQDWVGPGPPRRPSTPPAAPETSPRPSLRSVPGRPRSLPEPAQNPETPNR
ncbi:hypothetical protein GCM10023084_81910 [Streptomyces lacrimifluminis]|uniref:immunity 53 family protein n=1 Tax=Streptomyces lacrimifluminis TaxID=1500077 RepID=UPI001E507054|nr:immunity 53 family protein [Streptomyces lacrimifluminis]